jgi:N6-L-threonylcarbamoyladenine synthase
MKLPNDALPSTGSPLLALGLEGSANKLGVGVVQHNVDGSVQVLSNVRHTYITPPGQGFLPRDTAQHHKAWVIKIVRDSLEQADVTTLGRVDCICFTKGRLLNAHSPG